MTSQQPPATPAPAREVRKTVTVVFSDLVDSTALAAQLDAETLRGLMFRYFESMRVVLERHGGTLEKYAGDAIMAAFGVPDLHEDDALRAIRAAVEMRDALAALNEDLERAFGLRLAARIGVNTGEVFAADAPDGQLGLTGEAVIVAKRLEEKARTSEILIGEATRLLVRNAAVLEPVDAPTLKGIAPVRAWRLVGVLADTPALHRRLDAPLVDRELELALLRRAFERAVGGATGHFVTLLGAPGVGKSRLVNEVAAELRDGATVLHGRCLPYGEGMTYWPLGEVVREAAGVRAPASADDLVATIAGQLAGEEKAEQIAERVAETLGVAGPGAGTSEETFWAVRKLFEALARRRPLVVVFEDLHWAEPTFLDLVEHLADSRDGPFLLLCIARPELLEQRPSWGGGKVNATTILLEPLGQDDRRRLIANLLDGVAISADAEARIAEAAEGNPLFTEELVAMLIEDDLLRLEGDRWIAAGDLADLPVPPSIQTLLAARVGRLPDDERVLLGRASVEGVVFHRSAVAELSLGTPEATVDGALAALVRKEVIRLDRTGVARDDAYRFRHVLIRDAAYRSLPKATRADLHERFAGRLERLVEGGPGEYDEIVGYHLEQSYRCRLDLGLVDPAAASIATRAAERLESAARKALARGDLPAAIGLLERTASLLAADEEQRAALLPELGAALIEAGRLGRAEAVLDEAARLAAAADAERTAAHVLVQQQFLRLLRVAEGGTEEAERVVERVIPVFAGFDDQHGLCSAWRLQAWLHWNEARAAAAAEAWEQAAGHARRAGDEHARCEILTWIASSLWIGPTPVAEGIRRCDAIRDEVSGNLESEALTLRHLGGLHAMEGRLDLARSLLATSDAVFDDLGLTLNAATSHTQAVVELAAGDPVAAEQSLRSRYRALEEMGEKAFLSTTAAFLSRALFAQGRVEEAERFAQTSAELAATGDLLTQVLWRGVRGRILSGRGRLEEGEALAREAVALAERTDFLNHRADALIDLAHILQETGRVEEAGAAASDGLRLYEQKGNAVAARKIRSDLAALLPL